MRPLSVTDALNNINAITKVVEKSGDDQIVRATNTQLKTDEDVKTYFYVRTSKIDQLWQKLTDWTDGAKAKQALAKRLIISNLKTIINNNDFDKNFPDAEKRKEARANIEKIIATLEGVDKDITASMIKNDLTSLKGFFNSYETAEKKYDNFNRSPKSIQEAQDESLNDDQNFVAVSFHDPHAAEDTTITQDSFNSNPLYEDPYNSNPHYESKRQNPLNRGKSKELDPATSVSSDAATAASPLVNAASSKVITASPPVEKNISEYEMNFLFNYLGVEEDKVDQKKASSEIAKAVLNETEIDLDSTVFKPFWIEANAESEKNDLLVSVKAALNLASKEMSNSGSHKGELVAAEFDEGVQLISLPSELEVVKNNAKATILKNISSVVSNVNLKYVDNPVEEIISSPAEIHLMRETLKVVTIKKYESEQAVSPSPNLTASIKVAKSTPSPAPSAPSSKAETNSTATANPYLESLNTKWSNSENGYFEVSKPFYITGEMPTSKMLAQAYLLPEGKKLEFLGTKDEVSESNKNKVVRAEHGLRTDLDLTNEKRESRTYLKLEVKSDMKPFQGSPNMPLNPAVTRQAEQYKNSLITIYKDSVEKISDEYKKTNPGEELETLVITPITSIAGILLPVESTALVLAVKEIQLGNPRLKIAISADKESHSDAIRAAYET